MTDVEHGTGLGLKLDSPLPVDVSDLVDALQGARSVLKALAENEYAPAKSRLKWVVTDLRYGSAAFAISATPSRKLALDAAEFVGALARKVVTAVTTLQESGILPSWFPESATHSLREMLRPLQHVPQIDVSAGPERCLIDRRAADGLDEWLRGRYRDYGSLEGKIDLVNVHSGRYFNLYSELSDRAIRCDFPEQLFESVRLCLRHTVGVTGLVTYSRHDEPMAVAVEEVVALRATAVEIPEVDLTGGHDAVDHVRALRE